MSNKNLAKNINILADGKISIFLNSGEEVYLQPKIIVDTLDSNLLMIIRGEDKNNVDVDVDVEEIDGVPFVGDFLALEVALREAAKKANGLSLGGSSGGGAGGDASALNQEIQIANQNIIKSNQDDALAKITSLADGSASLIAIESPIIELLDLDTAINIVSPDLKRELITIQVHYLDVWIRLKDESIDANTRQGIFIKEGGSLSISTLSNGQKYTDAISIINSIDGETPNFSFTELKRP